LRAELWGCLFYSWAVSGSFFVAELEHGPRGA